MRSINTSPWGCIHGQRPDTSTHSVQSRETSVRQPLGYQSATLHSGPFPYSAAKSALRLKQRGSTHRPVQQHLSFPLLPAPKRKGSVPSLLARSVLWARCRTPGSRDTMHATRRARPRALGAADEDQHCSVCGLFLESTDCILVARLAQTTLGASTGQLRGTP